MLTFIEWLNESAPRSILKGWGKFGGDWRVAMVAKDAVMDGGTFKDIVLYLYRIGEFLNDKVKPLLDLNARQADYPFTPTHLSIGVEDVNYDNSLAIVQNDAQFFFKTTNDLMKLTTKGSEKLRTILLKRAGNLIGGLMKSANDIAQDSIRPELQIRMAKQIVAYLRKLDVQNFIRTNSNMR